MKPLIKWAGGKSGELEKIKTIIPEYDRYIEPFFGGGALFFYLEPKKAVINDICKELISLYNFIRNDGNSDFKRELDQYVEHWERIDKYIKVFRDEFVSVYSDYRANKLDDRELAEKISNIFDKKIVPFNGFFSSEFCIDRESLLRNIEKSLIAKLRRMKHTVDVQNNFSNSEVMKNVETAFRSGFYVHCRDIMNRSKRGELDISEEKRIANYYFVREFCYGSMFRFNEKGDFNIPYGGMGYNHKNFRKKVEYIFSKQVRELFQNAVIECMDFEKLLENYKPTSRDFMFLDPPYDTEFSEYEEHPFKKEDQVRLANCLLKTKAQFILIIKDTPLIRSLYEKKDGINITPFGKKYLYNVRGRNVRDVTHLIIHNLGLKQQKLANS